MIPRTTLAASINHQIFRLLMVVALFGLMVAPSRAQAFFPVDNYAYAADSYRDAIAKIGKTLKKTLPELQQDLDAAVAQGNNRNAAVVVEQMLALSSSDQPNWQKLADLLLIAEPFNSQDGYELPFKALGAAVRAYQLAGGNDRKAAALNDIAQALVKREDWRPALNAYRASLELAENAEIRLAYEELRKTHGFRITDYTVESDAPQPRLCFQFSDPLANSVSDFAPYLAQDPGAVSAVTVDGTKLCIEGLKHGERYKVTVRQGLPSSVDENLMRGRRIRDLCARSHAFGAIRRQILCAAARRPERHSTHFGQRRQGQARALSHRRPQSAFRGRLGSFLGQLVQLPGGRHRAQQGQESLGRYDGPCQQAQ